jgi:hypothetical protein
MGEEMRRNAVIRTGAITAGKGNRALSCRGGAGDHPATTATRTSTHEWESVKIKTGGFYVPIFRMVKQIMDFAMAGQLSGG